jgi:hypothetical protein
VSKPPPDAADDLDSRLAQLPRELPLARDLWPQIEDSLLSARAISPARARRVPLALAAGVALALTAGLIGWQAGRWRQPVASDVSASAAFAVPVDSAYLKTRAELEQTYRARLELLEPQTRRRVERDLALIRAANADIRRALAADPESAVLNRLLESVWQQEFDLYATVVRTTEPATQGNRT